jgi:metal-responsive CopG/Arc/MetJ family transcriptional regulator
MARYVLRLPESLAEKVEKAAEEQDKLPTEWIRDLLREAFEDKETEGSEDESET